MMRPESLARAMELDDQWPDDVCPGCQQNIAGWEKYPVHRTPLTEGGHKRLMDVRRYRRDTTPWPFMGDKSSVLFGEMCVWTSDYLNARRFRRRYIAQHQARAS